MTKRKTNSNRKAEVKTNGTKHVTENKKGEQCLCERTTASVRAASFKVKDES